jgi:hypothetical protein
MRDHDDPDNHKLRLHIEYRRLYAADLRAIVRTFERAYNILQKGVSAPPIGGYERFSAREI